MMAGAPDRVYHVALAYEPARPFAEVRFSRRLLGLGAPVIECVSISDDHEGKQWMVLIRRELGDDDVIEHRRPDPPANTEAFDRVMASIPRKYRRLVTYREGSPPPPPDPSVRRIELDSWTHMMFGLAVSLSLGEYQRSSPSRYGINTAQLARELEAFTPDEVIAATERLAAMPGIDLAPLRRKIEHEHFDADLAARIRAVIDPPAPGPDDADAAPMLACDHCGKKNDPATAYCLVCGSALPA